MCSRHQLQSPTHNLPAYQFQFRLRWSSVSAIGSPVDHEHSHVLRTTIKRDRYERALMAVLGPMPLPIKNIIRHFWPGLFLPDKVIVKKMKDGWEDEFEYEKVAYNTLKSVQGHLVPVCYGEATCDGTRAFILSEVDGVLPYEQDEPMDKSVYLERVGRACRELQAFGLYPGDIKLANILLVGDRIVFVDLESFVEVEDPGLRDKTFEVVMLSYARVYREYLEYLDRRNRAWAQPGESQLYPRTTR